MNSIYMSSTQEVISKQLLDVVPAANDDHLEHATQVPSVNVTDTASGWDAYEVWRRFIKDARDRRHPQGASAK